MKLLIEGLDRLGKSSLAKNVQDKLGYHLYIHYGKPEKLKRYTGSSIGCPLHAYQRELNENMFKLLESNANIIIDRAHLGETVYAPLYRGYDGGYVFNIEKKYNTDGVRLILLYADPDFVVEDDGKSIGDFSMRTCEQEEFKISFHRSNIEDKKMIKVNEGNKYRPYEDILKEVLA